MGGARGGPGRPPGCNQCGHPDVAVITSISLDHTAILGDTLAEIAAEKAGIIKPGVPVVSASPGRTRRWPSSSDCERHQAPLTLVGREWTWQPGAARLDGQAFTVRHGEERLSGLWIPLLGEHQLENATTAVAAVSLLEQQGARCPGHGHPRRPARSALARQVGDPGARPAGHRRQRPQRRFSEKADGRHQDPLRFRRLIMVLGASADHADPELLERFPVTG